MNTSRFGSLEVLAHAPAGTARGTPLLFVHGAYADAWCWEVHFLPWFARHGWAAYAVSLSGHGASPGRDHLDSLSIDDYVQDVAQVVAALPAPPALIGHSMGGFVVQKFLETTVAPAAVLLATVPPQGLLTSAFGLMFSKPGLMRELNRLMGGAHVSPDTLREALFAQPVDAARLNEFARHMQPESHRALWDMSLFNLPRTAAVARTPLAVMGAERDNLIPTSMTQLAARTYGVEPQIFAGLGHGLMLEHGWEPVAAGIHAWLDATLD